MAVLKCKMCGGDIVANAKQTYGTCDSCGTTMTLPKVSDEQRANLFNRANHFRRLNDFDKAIGAYERILAEDDRDAEAHWGVVLSRYGIEYVEDPATHERIPTCHRVQMESILSDADYLASLEHAPDGYTRTLYEQEAKCIAEVQRGILAISRQEEPYDVFICYKETTEAGTRTKDSAIAQDVYYQLVNEGYKVFFSRITLEDKLGQQYEPYIFAALNSAKVMVVIGTNAENFNAVWVKNEWSRYLALMKKDRTKLLIPCYRDMDAYDLPEKLSIFQSQDMGKIGFLQDLVRGIKKVVDGIGTTDSSKNSTSEITREVASAETDSLLRRAYIFIEDGNFNKATEYFDKVLDIEPENASAYWGLLMSKQSCRTEDQLYNYPIEHHDEYKKALRFAGTEQRAKYQSIADMFRQSISQKLDNGTLMPGATIIDNGFVLWDFTKSIKSAEHFSETPTTEELCDNIPTDVNPVVTCNNAKVVMVSTGSITLWHILPALEKIVQNKSVGIIVVCEPCHQEVLGALLLNLIRGTFKSLVLLLDSDVENRKKSILAISNITGAKVFETPEALRSVADDDIGIVSEFYACGDRAMFIAAAEHLEKLKEQEQLRLEEQHRFEQSNKWASQGLCRYCGGTLGFFKKCKSCHKQN